MDNNADISAVPIHIVNHASQLPAEFLDPSSEKQLVIGFDCEGIDLCRHGSLCIMQVTCFTLIFSTKKMDPHVLLGTCCHYSFV